MRDRNKIRIGLLVDNLCIPFWAYKMIEAINSGNYAEVVLVVKKKSLSNSNHSFIAKVQRNFNHIFYTLYRELENKIFTQNPDAFLKKDLKDLIEKAEVLEVDCIEKNFPITLQITTSLKSINIILMFL